MLYKFKVKLSRQLHMLTLANKQQMGVQFDQAVTSLLSGRERVQCKHCRICTKYFVTEIVLSSRTTNNCEKREIIGRIFDQKTAKFVTFSLCLAASVTKNYRFRKSLKIIEVCDEYLGHERLSANTVLAHTEVPHVPRTEWRKVRDSAGMCAAL